MRRGWYGLLATASVVVAFQAGMAAPTPRPSRTPFTSQGLGPALVTPVPVPTANPSVGGGGGGPGFVPNDPQSPGAGPVQGEETSPVGRRTAPPTPSPSPS
jgi:hypothetical protein